MLKKIAVLITSYNRKQKTLNCLTSLYNSDLPVLSGDIDIFLVDDGSTDGTAAAVAEQFPQVKVIKGTGNLYWARGMMLAWETADASGEKYDAYFLLNDDVILRKDIFINIQTTHEYCLKNYYQEGIYICSTQDPLNKKITYGGTLINKKRIRVKKYRIIPSQEPVQCTMANANILIVTEQVVKRIGKFDPVFVQKFADYDYTYRASKAGIPVLVCPAIGGYCKNDHPKGWLSFGTSLKKRLEYLYSPKGLEYHQQLYYLKKHFKFQLPYYFFMLWMKTLFPIFWDMLKKEE